MDAETILNTKLRDAQNLLGVGDSVTITFRRLAKAWHPDHCKHPKAQEVLSHLVALREHALVGPQQKFYEFSHKGRGHRAAMLDATVFSDAERIIGPHWLGYRFTNLTMFNRFTKRAVLKFDDKAMKDQFEILLPEPVRSYDLDEGRGQLVVFRRRRDAVPLDAVINHFNSAVPAAHVAWIISGMLNMLCYLKHRGIVHTSISPSTVFIGAATHTVHLYGGWGYATPVGQKIEFADAEMLKQMPHSLYSKPASHRLDIRLVKEVGLAMSKNTTLPAPLKAWLLDHSENDPLAAYRDWLSNTLVASFGARRFTELKLSSSDIYEG